MKKKTTVASEESVTTATTTTVHQKHEMRRWKEVKKLLKEAEKVVVFTSRLTKAIRDTRRQVFPVPMQDKSLQRRKWRPSRGGKRAAGRWKLKEADKEAQVAVRCLVSVTG